MSHRRTRDVAAALPRVMADSEHAHDIAFATALPLYGAIGDKLKRSQLRRVEGLSVEAKVGGETFRNYALDEDGAWPVYFLECNALFDGPSLYEMPEGSPHTLRSDSAFLPRGSSLCRPSISGPNRHSPPARLARWTGGAFESSCARDAAKAQDGPDHSQPGFSGVVSVSEAPELTELDPDEHFSFLQQGIVNADQITTVSPRYAVEVQTQAFGCGLEQLLCRRGVVGIVNGIDDVSWNPLPMQLLMHRSRSMISRGESVVVSVCWRMRTGLIIPAHRFLRGLPTRSSEGLRLGRGVVLVR